MVRPDLRHGARASLAKEIDEIRASGKPIIEFTKRIEYDASNAFGVLIRDKYSCTFTSIIGDENDANKLTVRVDGMTSIDWSLARIEQGIKQLSP